MPQHWHMSPIKIGMTTVLFTSTHVDLAQSRQSINMCLMNEWPRSHSLEIPPHQSGSPVFFC